MLHVLFITNKSLNTEKKYVQTLGNLITSSILKPDHYNHTLELKTQTEAASDWVRRVFRTVELI